MLKINNTRTQALSLARSIMSSGVTPVIDLDGVLLDATHRQNCNPDGSLNLTAYRKNSTPEKIARDKPLPLLAMVHEFNANGYKYHVATARVLCESTAKLLAVNKVNPMVAMGRNGENDNRKDYILKTDHLVSKFDQRQRENMILIDDNLANCKAVIECGLKAVHVNFEGH